MPLKENDRAPDFSLPDQKGKVHKLVDYKGSWLLLYFYPKDATPGCTIEACVLRDGFEDFKSKGASVLGVSTDSVSSHEKFAVKYKLPFPLLADAEKTLVKAYGVWGPKKFMGREFLGTKRTSFLIGPDGRIVKIYENVKPAGHAAEVLADLGTLKQN